MNAGFVPLTVSMRAAVPGSATPGKAASPSPGATRFRPLAAPGAPTQPPHPAIGEPKLTVEREGDRVTRILIQCPCGHVIELACEY